MDHFSNFLICFSCHEGVSQAFQPALQDQSIRKAYGALPSRENCVVQAARAWDIRSGLGEGSPVIKVPDVGCTQDCVKATVGV